jgi:hypothetical protein
VVDLGERFPLRGFIMGALAAPFNDPAHWRLRGSPPDRNYCTVRPTI